MAVGLQKTIMRGAQARAAVLLAVLGGSGRALALRVGSSDGERMNEAKLAEPLDSDSDRHIMTLTYYFAFASETSHKTPVDRARSRPRVQAKSAWRPHRRADCHSGVVLHL